MQDLDDTKFYPEVQGALVNWVGGSGGGFLTVLLYFYYYQTFENLSLSSEGRAHHLLNLINCNTKIPDYNLHVSPVYKYATPINTSKYTILFDHYPCEPKDFFAIYPKCKLVSIAYKDIDRQLIYGNLFFKDGETLFQNAPHLRKYKSRFEIPNDVMENFLTTASTSIHRAKIADIFSTNFDCPVEYSDRIYQLEFKKVMRDKVYIIDKLTTITGKGTPNGVSEFIDQYLEKQSILIKSKMPWLLDYFYSE